MTDTATTLKRKETRRDSDQRLGWAVVGDHGAIEFWIQKPASASAYRGRELFGGVETHQRTPMEYSISQETPDHADCAVLGGPCWHDGTSLWAMEHWIPMYEVGGEEWVWRELEQAYRDTFGNSEIE